MNDQINFNNPNFYYKKRGHGKWKNFWLAVLVIGVGSLFFNLGGWQNSISIENPSWWQKIGSIFASSVEEVDKKKDLTAELNRQFPMPKKESNRLDILIMGIRGKDDPDGGLLSDAMMLLSFDKETKKTSLVSLPRDIYVELPGIHTGKINELYVVGLTQKNSLNFTEKVFSRITGVYIDNAIVFDFESFKGIVDTIEGVDVNLKKPFEEKTQWGYGFSLPAGPNHLDGQAALYYVRSRYSSNDFDRSRRQQEVMLAIKNKVLSLDLLKNPTQIPGLLGHLKSDITTDLDIWDSRSLFNVASAFDTGTLNTKTLSTDNILIQTIQNGTYILLPQNNNWIAFRKYLQNILTPQL